MPGFGSGSFGSSPFGLTDAAENLLWKSLPLRWRDADVQGYAKKLFDAFSIPFNSLRSRIEELKNQLDPYKVKGIEIKEISIDSAQLVEDDYFGNVVKLIVTMGEDLTDLGVFWTVIISGKRYKVIRIRQRNEPETQNEIWLDTNTLPDLTGDPVFPTFTFSCPSLLALLYKEFGFTIDEHDSEYYQRAILAHAFQLLQWKSAELPYIIRGEYSGWNVRVLGLWRITAEYATLLGGLAFEIWPGEWYTYLNPEMAMFEDIPSDTYFNDPDVGMTYLLDNHLIYDDSSPDGYSPAKWFSINVMRAEPVTPLFLTVTSSTPMTPSELSAEMMAYGYKVELSMTQTQRDKIGYIKKGIFALDDYLGIQYFIEKEVSYDGGTSTWTVYLGTPVGPAVGESFGVHYYPGVNNSCGFCRSYFVDVTMTSIGVPPVDLDNAVVRFRDTKIKDFLPIHARIARITANGTEYLGPF